MLRSLRPLAALPLLGAAACSLINGYDDVPGAGGGAATSSSSSGGGATTSSSSSAAGGGEGPGSSSSSAGGGGGGGGGSELPPLPQLECTAGTPIQIDNTAGFSNKQFTRLRAFRANYGQGTPRNRVIALRPGESPNDPLATVYEVTDTGSPTTGSFHYGREIMSLGRVGDGIAALLWDEDLNAATPEIAMAVWPDGATVATQPVVQAVANVEGDPIAVREAVFHATGPHPREIDMLVQYTQTDGAKVQFHHFDPDPSVVFTSTSPMVVNTALSRSRPRALTRTASTAIAVVGDNADGSQPEGAGSFEVTLSNLEFASATMTPGNASFLDASPDGGSMRVAGVTFDLAQQSASLRVGKVGGGQLHGLDLTPLRRVLTFTTDTNVIGAVDARFHGDAFALTGRNAAGAMRIILVRTGATPEETGVVFDEVGLIDLPGDANLFTASTVAFVSPLVAAGTQLDVFYTTRNNSEGETLRVVRLNCLPE